MKKPHLILLRSWHQPRKKHHQRRLFLDKHLFQNWATEEQTIEESTASALTVKKAETAGKTVAESQPSTAAS